MIIVTLDTFNISTSLLMHIEYYKNQSPVSDTLTDSAQRTAAEP